MPLNASFCLCSLADNNLTNYGKDMSGVLKLVEALPQPKITKLECAATPLLPNMQSVNAH